MGRCITYRYHGSVKGRDEFAGHMPDNARAVGNPDRVDVAAGQEQGPQVGKGIAGLEDADHDLGRGRRGEGAAGRHCAKGGTASAYYVVASRSGGFAGPVDG